MGSSNKSNVSFTALWVNLRTDAHYECTVAQVSNAAHTYTHTALFVCATTNSYAKKAAKLKEINQAKTAAAAAAANQTAKCVDDASIAVA